MMPKIELYWLKIVDLLAILMHIARKNALIALQKNFAMILLKARITMAEYIEREKLEEAFDNAGPDVCENYTDGHSDWGFGRENVRDVIRGVPAADVAPVGR